LKTIGEKIADLRKEKKVSQVDLAKKAFISRSALAHYETNKSVPPAGVIYLIANILGTEPENLDDRLNALKGIDAHSKMLENRVGKISKKMDTISNIETRQLIDKFDKLVINNRKKAIEYIDLLLNSQK
jgi:transcriptional regulator with XRE-family HTH domain